MFPVNARVIGHWTGSESSLDFSTLIFQETHITPCTGLKSSLACHFRLNWKVNRFQIHYCYAYWLPFPKPHMNDIVHPCLISRVKSLKMATQLSLQGQLWCELRFDFSSCDNSATAFNSYPRTGWENHWLPQWCSGWRPDSSYSWSQEKKLAESDNNHYCSGWFILSPTLPFFVACSL